MTWTGTGTPVTPSPVSINYFSLGAAMLDIARLLGGLRSGEATGGSTTTLVDTKRKEETEYWTGGTIWITSGTNNGIVFPVSSFVSNTITIPTTLASAITAGDQYHVLPPEFPMDLLRHAVQSALNELGDIISSNVAMTTDEDAEDYDLPDNVYNLLRVEIATSDASPYGYQVHYYWKELNGRLYFLEGKAPAIDGYKIRLWYKAPHPVVFDYDDQISDTIDRKWLTWAGVANVLRNSLGLKGKDKAIHIDLLNQALMKESEFRQKQNKKNMVIVSRDPILNP